eukprot:2863072-Heterocapsa_arctica.AAC.1
MGSLAAGLEEWEQIVDKLRPLPDTLASEAVDTGSSRDLLLSRRLVQLATADPAIKSLLRG